MNIPCDLILDLLPMYQNNLCSEITEAIITEHLETCDKCCNILDAMERVTDIPNHEADVIFENLLKAACRCES